jgi:predicted TIM-barrel fold metal-dependent hydrolase
MEMIAIARSKANIVCDLSGWLSWIRSGESLSFYKSWRYMMNMLGSNRLMFASDTTNLIDDIEYAAWIKVVTSIPEEIKREGITFSDNEMEDFFSKTSIRVLNLKEPL